MTTTKKKIDTQQTFYFYIHLKLLYRACKHLAQIDLYCNNYFLLLLTTCTFFVLHHHISSYFKYLYGIRREKIYILLATIMKKKTQKKTHIKQMYGSSSYSFMQYSLNKTVRFFPTHIQLPPFVIKFAL